VARRRSNRGSAPRRVGIYACGPTVYGPIHVGNARPFVVYSVLKRFLEHEGYATTLVANITDVNDKIYDAARPGGHPQRPAGARDDGPLRAGHDGPRARAARRRAAGRRDDRADHRPDRGPDRGGHAYAAEGDVFFRVRSDPQYGSLSHRAVDDMDQGEGVEGAARKEDPLDFALWKAQKAGEDTAWDAPWGRGRPGWHIECSAMAEELLGVGFDIHGGGNDLVFPHHENEAPRRAAPAAPSSRRSGCTTGCSSSAPRRWPRAWATSRRCRGAGRLGPRRLLLFFLSGHYRQPLQFDDAAREQAQGSVRRLRDAGRRLVAGPSPPELAPLRERFLDRLADDFNTPAALAVVFDWVSEAHRRADRGEATGDADLRELLAIFALDGLLDADDEAGPDPAALELLERRQTARAARDFDEADRLREELAGLGWQVRDSADGPRLVRA
jgi:cysteinyl-tRNA synthetase